MKEKLKKASKGNGSKIRKEIVLEKLKHKQFNQEIYNKQKSRILKRDAIQTKINRRLERLASKLEKEKIIEEK